MKISSRITDLESLLIIFEAKLNSIDAEHTGNPTPPTTADAAVKSVNQNENSQHSIDENTLLASSSSGSDVRNSNNDQSRSLDLREAVSSATLTASAEHVSIDSIRPFPPPPPPPPPPPTAPSGSVLPSIIAIAITTELSTVMLIIIQK